MVHFFRFALLYNAAAMVVSVLMRDGETVHILGSCGLFVGVFKHQPVLMLGIAAAVLVSLYLYRDSRRVKDVLCAFFGLLLLKTGFTMVKGSMAIAGTFWADPMLSSVDNWLHFGNDPWVFTHQLSGYLNASLLSMIYVKIWLIVVFGFPVVVAALDRDEERQKRFMALYFVAWVFIGNVMAFAFLSAGPIYYTEFHGGTQFAGLYSSLDDIGVNNTLTGFLHGLLLHQLYEGNMVVGSGISAFPSVHVAVTTVVALYLIEIAGSWVTKALALVSLTTIMFLSVYLGWHYAVDGYASMAVVYGAWYALKSGIALRWWQKIQAFGGARAQDAQGTTARSAYSDTRLT